jgi:hypothetical protein
VNGTEDERLRRAVERLMDGQREALEVLRQTLDSQAPAEDALGDLEGASAILGVEEGNGEDGA